MFIWDIVDVKHSFILLHVEPVGRTFVFAIVFQKFQHFNGIGDDCVRQERRRAIWKEGNIFGFLKFIILNYTIIMITHCNGTDTIHNIIKPHI